MQGYVRLSEQNNPVPVFTAGAVRHDGKAGSKTEGCVVMGDQQSEKAYEENRLKRTLSLAAEQLKAAKEAAERTKSEIMEAKEEMREDATHGIISLSSTEDFEAIVELSQYQNPILSRIADYEGKEHQIRLLERMMMSPYFARIDFLFEGEDGAEEIYIGRTSLKRGNTQEMEVYDWRSPVASVFYRFMTGKAFYDAPCGRIAGEVTKKRQYEIKNGTLAYFFDADVEIVDEFLRQLLSQNTTAKMKAIVETIQREQDAAIRDMESDLLMVQGVAGSGKTSIALHRAAYLMYQGLQNKLAANQIMIISPNRVFEQYISGVLPELGEEQVKSAVFDDLLRGIILEKKIQPRNEFLEKLLMCPDNAGTMKKSIRFKTSERFWQMLDCFISDIPDRWVKLEDVIYEGKCVVSGRMLKEKLRKAVSGGGGRVPIPLGVRLEQLEEYVLECAFGGTKSRGVRAEMSAVRQEVQRMLKLDIPALYFRLFQEDDYVWELINEAERVGVYADGDRKNGSVHTSSGERQNGSVHTSNEERENGSTHTPDGDRQGAPDDASKSTEDMFRQELREIRAYTLQNMEAGSRLQYDDAVAIAYLYLRIFGTEEYRMIRQVVIDEAQDYYPLQYRIFGLLFPKAKFTVLGDQNQTIEKQEDDSFYERIAGILDHKTSSTVLLNKSFRCTNEILNFSLRFLPKQEPEACGPEIKSFNRSGDEVVVAEADSTGELTDKITEEIEICRKRGYGSIGLLCKTEAKAAGLYQKLKPLTDVRLIRSGSVPDLQGVFLIPLYMAKGLEFDAVILCDADSSYYDEDDRHLLYVACTRALHRLSVFCVKERSPFL